MPDFKMNAAPLAGAFAGLLDVSLSCALLLGTDVLSALLWGMVGALAGAALTWTIRRYSVAETEGDGFADRMAKVHDNIDGFLDEGDPDPLWKRWAGNVLIATGGAILGAALLALAFSRSLITILVFAYVAQPVSAWLVLAVLVASAGLQLLVAWVTGGPLAQRLGLTGEART